MGHTCRKNDQMTYLRSYSNIVVFIHKMWYDRLFCHFLSCCPRRHDLNPQSMVVETNVLPLCFQCCQMKRLQTRISRCINNIRVTLKIMIAIMIRHRVLLCWGSLCSVLLCYHFAQCNYSESHLLNVIILSVICSMSAFWVSLSSVILYYRCAKCHYV